MDESNSTQAHSNYLIYMRFITVSMVGTKPGLWTGLWTGLDYGLDFGLSWTVKSVLEPLFN